MSGKIVAFPSLVNDLRNRKGPRLLLVTLPS
jgi:hypothetical protein